MHDDDDNDDNTRTRSIARRDVSILWVMGGLVAMLTYSISLSNTTDAGDLSVCNGRCNHVLWPCVCGWYVGTSRVYFRCHGDMHKLPRW